MTIEEALQKHSVELMEIPGVVGTGQGMCNDRPCIKVFVKELTDPIRSKIPGTIEGYPVMAEETGMFRTF
ncbi:MAG: hypothetical protein ACQETA_10605 [Bacteroidota bacterium]